LSEQGRKNQKMQPLLVIGVAFSMLAVGQGCTAHSGCPQDEYCYVNNEGDTIGTCYGNTVSGDDCARWQDGIGGCCPGACPAEACQNPCNTPENADFADGNYPCANIFELSFGKHKGDDLNTLTNMGFDAALVTAAQSLQCDALHQICCATAEPTAEPTAHPTAAPTAQPTEYECPTPCVDFGATDCDNHFGQSTNYPIDGNVDCPSEPGNLAYCLAEVRQKCLAAQGCGAFDCMCTTPAVADKPVNEAVCYNAGDDLAKIKASFPSAYTYTCDKCNEQGTMDTIATGARFGKKQPKGYDTAEYALFGGKHNWWTGIPRKRDNSTSPWSCYHKKPGSTVDHDNEALRYFEEQVGLKPGSCRNLGSGNPVHGTSWGAEYGEKTGYDSGVLSGLVFYQPNSNLFGHSHEVVYECAPPDTPSLKARQVLDARGCSPFDGEFWCSEQFGNNEGISGALEFNSFDDFRKGAGCVEWTPTGQYCKQAHNVDARLVPCGVSTDPFCGTHDLADTRCPQCKPLPNYPDCSVSNNASNAQESDNQTTKIPAPYGKYDRAGTGPGFLWCQQEKKCMHDQEGVGNAMGTRESCANWKSHIFMAADDTVFDNVDPCPCPNNYPNGSVDPTCSSLDQCDFNTQCTKMRGEDWDELVYIPGTYTQVCFDTKQKGLCNQTAGSYCKMQTLPASNSYSKGVKCGHGTLKVEDEDKTKCNGHTWVFEVSERGHNYNFNFCYTAGHHTRNDEATYGDNEWTLR